MLIGYARVSTEEQETHAQTDALKSAGCNIIYEEKRSGGSLRRPVLHKLLHSIKSTDTLVVYKIDRMARSLKDLLLILEKLEASGAKFKSLTETIDTCTPSGRMILQILGAFAEFERELIRERTKVGMAAAMARGSKPGRPRGLTPDDEAEVIRLWRSGGKTKTELGRTFGVHISSIKRALARAREQEQPRLF